ncbi:hypothetical protein ACB092_07G011500 [Castanea dentata]
MAPIWANAHKIGPIRAESYTDIKPLGYRVLVKIKTAEEKTDGGILFPKTAQTKPQGGEVVATGEGKTVGKKKVDISVKIGTQIVYSKYAGTELEFNGSKHLILKDDDIELKPLNDRILIKVAKAEEKTARALLLTKATKEKPSIETDCKMGFRCLGRLMFDFYSALDVTSDCGSIIMYSNYDGIDFKGKDGYDYIALRVSDVMAVLS